MTSGEHPSEAPGADGLDLRAALVRGDALGLPLNEVTRPGVVTNLELLAEHYRAVCNGLNQTGVMES